MQSAIREALTEGEINDCLSRAFLSLSPKDQENLQPVIDELVEMPLMGPKGALRLIFAVDQAPALAKLNETLKGG